MVKVEEIKDKTIVI